MFKRAMPVAILFIAVSMVTPVVARGALSNDPVGAAYKIMRDIEWSQTDGIRSTGNSSDRDTLIERVIAVREDGVELEYDLPKVTHGRSDNWQFPVRVFKPLQGPLQLLNGPELEARVDIWLKKGGMSRAACGRWIFTWNAFRIDCDPQSVLETIEGFDIRGSGLRAGATYTYPQASSSIILRQTYASPVGAAYAGEALIDTNQVRNARARSDVVAAEISGEKPLTLDDALRAHATDKVSGTIAITLETDKTGATRQRMTVTKVKITTASGEAKESTTTEVITRMLVAHR